MLTSINVTAENTDHIQLATPSNNQLSKSNINNATKIPAYYCDSRQTSTRKVSTTADKSNSIKIEIILANAVRC